MFILRGWEMLMLRWGHRFIREWDRRKISLKNLVRVARDIFHDVFYTTVYDATQVI